MPTDPRSDSIQIDRESIASEFIPGRWFWVSQHDGEDPGDQWLGCVVHVGSNFVELKSPTFDNSCRHTRVHFRDCYRLLRSEPNAQGVIAGRIALHQTRLREAFEDVRSLTAALGIEAGPQAACGDNATGALMVLNGTANIDAYKASLVMAKESRLPALLATIKAEQGYLAGWMSADLLALEVATRGLSAISETINDRIYNVSLYAGLTEDCVLVRNGAPAPATEKLRVMQRRLYMDEECIAGYRAGGIDFSRIGQFDDWLAEPANLARVLPFPRCMVAFRVRRESKQRSWDGTLQQLFVNVRLYEQDKLTFLYVRNGERLYRVAVALEFDEMIFPDSSIFDASEPLMFDSTWASSIRFMTVREWESRMAERTATKAKEQAYDDDWKAANPGKSTFGNKNPYRHQSDDSITRYQPFTSDSVYYDEAKASLNAQVKKYNRIALIIQGLFDRSEALHPHAPVKTWTPEGFAAAVELVYDASRALYGGEEPDIEAYIAGLNAQITPDSILYGQDEFWARAEGVKETARRQRHLSTFVPDIEFYRPHGDPGPGLLAVPQSWKPRSRQAIFTWSITRWSSSQRDDIQVRRSITVPVSELFNVSAYKRGDYKRFFSDPRTREKYLKWAPAMLAAEDYHSGKRMPRYPS